MDVSRRQFIKTAGMTTGGGLLAKYSFFSIIVAEQLWEMTRKHPL
ncbi:twin-arginine translocation signal domain-containing protein [Oceanobacillus oncorhynchi]